MWKPSVKAICSRAASRLDADAASGSGVETSIVTAVVRRGAGSPRASIRRSSRSCAWRRMGNGQ